MPTNIAEKVVLITGASSGIGRELAIFWLEKDTMSFWQHAAGINYRRSQKRSEPGVEKPIISLLI